jgi:hypothetical protein
VVGPQTTRNGVVAIMRVVTHHARASSGRKSRRSFTFFEARSIKFVIVVYSECMHVDGRLALSQL